MSDKSVFYIVLAFILISFFGALRDIGVEFIKAANQQEATPNMMMSPFFFNPPSERQQKQEIPLNGRDIAEI